MECKICGTENPDNKCSKCGYSFEAGNIADVSLVISPQELKSRLDKKERILLLDVRSQEEHDIAKILGSFLMPLHELSEKYQTLTHDRTIAIYCHHGMRSMNAARFLSQKGFKNIKSLEGGIHLWSCLIDKKIPTY